jgi:aryl sulfotransferase
VVLDYDDLLRDLPGQMRALADRLDIDVPESLWPTLVEAASIQQMREHSEVTVPGSAPGQWRDPDRFFHRGTSGQWRELLDDDGVRRYAERARSLATAELVGWAHRPELP